MAPPLSKETLVPIGSAIAVAIAVLNGYSKFVEREAATQARMSAIEHKIETLSRKAWSCEDHRLFLLELRLANRNLVMPTMHKECSE